mgnify:CR=1 FL=1
MVLAVRHPLWQQGQHLVNAPEFVWDPVYGHVRCSRLWNLQHWSDRQAAQMRYDSLPGGCVSDFTEAERLAVYRAIYARRDIRTYRPGLSPTRCSGAF